MFISFIIIVGLIYYISRLQIHIDKVETLYAERGDLIAGLNCLAYDQYQMYLLAKDYTTEMYYDTNTNQAVFIPDLIKVEDL